MKQLVLAILALIILSFSNETMAAELYRKEALQAIADPTYQIEQQYIICRTIYGNTKNARTCFAQSTKAYKLFVSWSLHNAGKNETMDRCLESSLEYYWIPAMNTAPWDLVISGAWMCYEEKLSK